MSVRLRLGLGAVAVGMLSSCGVGGTASPPPTGSPVSAGAVVCTAEPQAHVYHPDRLRLLNACVTVSGTIESVTPEPDGDDHVRLRLDPGQACAGEPCVNAGNVSGQHGDLLLEPVCEHAVTQADAVAACTGWRDPLASPPVGRHVTVSGPWVLDMDHGWNEIHPLEAVRVS